MSFITTINFYNDIEKIFSIDLIYPRTFKNSFPQSVITINRESFAVIDSSHHLAWI